MADANEFTKAARALARKDLVMRDIIRNVGKLDIPDAREPFPALVSAIIYQQLAGAAASAILRRFLALYSKNGSYPAPRALLKTPDEKLRSVGLSRQKASYLKDLAANFADGRLTDSKLGTLPDEELEALLMSVKGVGRWTADMFLIFTLHRMDILPVGDLGVRKSVQQAYELAALPTPKQLTELGEQWRPYRSVASLYLWRKVDGA